MIIDNKLQDDWYCKYEKCRKPLGEKYKTRDYCDNNNKCKNAHHAAKTKQELNMLREEHSLGLRKKHTINCLRQLCKFKKFRYMTFEEFEMFNLNLNEVFFSKIEFGDSMCQYIIDVFILSHSEKARRIYIQMLPQNLRDLN